MTGPLRGSAEEPGAGAAAEGLERKVVEAQARDVGRAYARLDPADLERLGLAPGDLVEVAGRRATVAKVMPCFPEHRGQGRVQLDGLGRDNAGVALDDVVQVRPTSFATATRVRIAATDGPPRDRDLPYVGSLLDGVPVRTGDRVRAVLFGNRRLDFDVLDTEPPTGPGAQHSPTAQARTSLQPPTISQTPTSPEEPAGRLEGRGPERHPSLLGAVLIQPDTVLEIASSDVLSDGPARRGPSSPGATTASGRPSATLRGPRSASGGAQPSSPAAARRDGSRRRVSYEDVGGLGRELHRVREMIELPLRFPEVFERLGIDAPKGVLLHGPPGCGKTLIARAIAHETDAALFLVNGPEVVHKLYGESEAHLRRIFEEAERHAPSLVFLDEVDSIAPRRDRASGDVEKRVVAQLLALMDGLNPRRNVVVLAATNLPDALDPALRRPGRFDREISLAVPDRPGRREILEIHTRGMPLAGDVDLEQLASVTHGFVGADLEALCREAAMLCLRRQLPALERDAVASQPHPSDPLSMDRLAALRVTADDFAGALREVGPSAIREVFVEVPDVTWDDVGGLAEVRARLEEAVVWPLSHPELFQSARVAPPRGILLAGPPGTGKTLCAKAVAATSGLNFLSVKGSELLDKYVGESERAVRQVFAKARQAAPAVLFLDEVDALLPARGSSAADRVSDRVLSQVLAEMDGIEELQGVLVLAATNRLDLLDPAAVRPGRFEVVIEVPAPDTDGRRAVLDVHLRDKPLAPDVDREALVSATGGRTGADLAGMVRTAALAAVRRVVDGTDERPEIRQQDLLDALERLYRPPQRGARSSDADRPPAAGGVTGSP